MCYHGRMTVLLRSLIVWFLLLALPYQGYAAAAMMACAPSPATAASVEHLAMPSGPHDHAAMLAAMAQDKQHMQDKPDQADNASSHAGHGHGGVKCGGSGCCIAGAPVLADMLAVPALPAVSGAVPGYVEFLPAVHLAHPERPPQV